MAKHRDRRHTSWWQDKTNGVTNWLAVVLVAVVAAASVAGVAYLMQRNNVPSATGATYSPEPFSIAPQKDVALFIGDSYSAGAGASAKNTRWTALAASQLGWSEFNRALGGTGYVTTAAQSGCGLEYCGTYAEAIADVSDTSRPDIIVISGGRNDNTRFTRQAAEDTIRAAQQRWPEARVVVTSPLWDASDPPYWMDDSIEGVREAAAATGVTFLDLGQPLADHEDWITSDRVHPNDSGYVAIADSFVNAWRSAFPS